MSPIDYEVLQLTQDDLGLMAPLMTVFGEAFNDKKAYTRNRPTPGYMKQLLASDYFVYQTRDQGRGSAL